MSLTFFKLRENKFKYLFLSLFLFNINFIIALPNQADNNIDFNYPITLTTNFSTITVNNSPLWNGYPFSYLTNNYWKANDPTENKNYNSTGNVTTLYGFFNKMGVGNNNPFAPPITEGIPDGSMEVNGYLVIKPNYGLIGLKRSGDGYITLINQDSEFNIAYYSLENITWKGAGTTKMILTGSPYDTSDDNKLGLGVSNPSEKFTLKGNIWMTEDSNKLLMGDNKEASLDYDGTNLIINPKEVGSGILNILSDINTTGNVTASFLKGYLNLSYIQNNPWSYNQTLSALNIVNNNMSIIKNNTSPTFVNLTTTRLKFNDIGANPCIVLCGEWCKNDTSTYYNASNC